MRPYPEELLRIIQSGVMAHMLPEIESNYGRAQFTFSMLLFGIAQKDYDSAVPDLIDENAALRALLVEASDALGKIDRPDARAGRESVDALPAASGSLRLSALRAENNALREALAALAPLIEPAAELADLAPLREVRARVYERLTSDARRRMVPILTA